MAEADLVIAVGTEFGPTDYDMYGDGGFVAAGQPDPHRHRRRPARAPPGDGADRGRLREALEALLAALAGETCTRADGEARRAPSRARGRLRRDRPGASRRRSRAVETIRDALPGAIIVGDSTQPVYAANLYYDHDRPGGWFNAATGFGALGYGPPAAIGAALAVPDAPVVCLTGDGGFQFTLPELGAARRCRAPVIFVVWNNRGYREIETSMLDVGVEPVGVSPAPPDFCKLADAYGIAAERLTAIGGLADALRRAGDGKALSHRDHRRIDEPAIPDRGGVMAGMFDGQAHRGDRRHRRAGRRGAEAAARRRRDLPCADQPCRRAADFAFTGHDRVGLVPNVDLTDAATVDAFYAAVPDLFASIHLAGGFAMAASARHPPPTSAA